MHEIDLGCGKTKKEKVPKEETKKKIISQFSIIESWLIPIIFNINYTNELQYLYYIEWMSKQEKLPRFYIIYIELSEREIIHYNNTISSEIEIDDKVQVYAGFQNMISNNHKEGEIQILLLYLSLISMSIHWLWNALWTIFFET